MNLRNKNLIKDFGYDSFVLSGGMQGGGGVAEDLLIAKGDTHGYTTENARVPIGTDGQILTADSSVPLGLAWETTGGGVEYNTFTTATTWNPTTQTGNTKVTVDNRDLSVGSVNINVDGSSVSNSSSGTTVKLVNPSSSLSVDTIDGGYNVSGANAGSISFNLTTQDSNPTTAFFKSDGTKMYMGGYSGDKIYQYSLSTAWDVSTATYDSISFSVISQATYLRGLFFKSDGTEMYVSCGSTNKIYQYSLSTAWDLSTASYSSKSLDVSAQGLYPRNIYLKSDGTKIYYVAYGSDIVYQYSLGTAWDLSTATYDSKYFSISAQETSPMGLFFKSDGTKMYMCGLSNDKVFQYSLSVAYDVSTASYDGISLNILSQDNDPSALTFSPTGNIMYMVGDTNNTIYQYPLATSWDLSTALYTQRTISVGSQDMSPSDVFFKPDGTKMYMLGDSANAVYQYTLSTSWNLSTATYDSVSYSVSGQETQPTGFFFKSDGTKMYVTGQASGKVFEYHLSTAWDISTSSYVQSFTVSGQVTIERALSFSSDGANMYVVDYTGTDSVYQYSLSTAWDVSTASYTSKSFSFTAQEPNPNGITFKSDGTKMYVVGLSDDTVFQYSLSIAWDVSTASYDSVSFSVASQASYPTGLYFGNGGTDMYLSAESPAYIYQYSTSTPYSGTVKASVG